MKHIALLSASPLLHDICAQYCTRSGDVECSTTLEPKEADLVITDQAISGTVLGPTIVIGQEIGDVVNSFVTPIATPFHLQEFFMAIERALADNTSLRLGGYRFFPQERMLIYETTKTAFYLTEKETDLLLYLYKRQGDVTDTLTLLQDVWGYSNQMDTHTLQTHIYRLRQKIDNALPGAPALIVTDDEGYRLGGI